MDSSHFPTFACTDLASATGRAVLQKKIFPLVWKIENFTQNEWKKIQICGTICGPDFKFYPLSEELWTLELGTKDMYNDYGLQRCLSIAIRKVSKGTSTSLRFNISWSAETNGKSKYLESYAYVPVNKQYYEFQLLIDDEMTDFIVNNVKGSNICNMVIRIENIDIDVVRQTANSVKCDIKADFESSLDKGKLAVLADMEYILKEPEFTDIALRSEGKEIPAHRAILAGRSEVFRSMFVHQMSEKASGSVDISDVPYDILQLLVTYMYSGRLVDLDVKSASELFVASDKYDVEDLHHACSLFLKGSLTVENCLEILMLADSHSNRVLKSSAVAYFSNHSKEICQKPDWGNVIQVRPAIALELLEVLASK